MGVRDFALSSYHIISVRHLFLGFNAVKHLRGLHINVFLRRHGYRWICAHQFVLSASRRDRGWWRDSRSTKFSKTFVVIGNLRDRMYRIIQRRDRYALYPSWVSIDSMTAGAL